MYPVMIVTFLAAIYMSMLSPKQVYDDPATSAPTRSALNVDITKGDDLGIDLAIYGTGIQNMVTRLLLSPQGRIDLSEELAANAGSWIVAWDDIEDFFAASGNGNDYRAALAPAPSAEALRASFFKPGYATTTGFGGAIGPAGPWRALIVQQTVGGVPQNDVSAILIFADLTQAGFNRDARNMGAMLGGMQRTLTGTAMVGLATDNNRLVTRGYINNQTLVGTNWVSTGAGRADIDGLPAAIPPGTPVHLICMRASAPQLAYCDA